MRVHDLNAVRTKRGSSKAFLKMDLAWWDMLFWCFSGSQCFLFFCYSDKKRGEQPADLRHKTQLFFAQFFKSPKSIR